MHCYKVLEHAIGTEAKGVRAALRSLGKRCSLRWIYYQCQPARDVKRLNIYELFWRFFKAIFLARPEGAAFLFEDFRSRYAALRARDELRAADWYTQVATCESEHSEAIQAAILNRDDAALRKELPEAIAAYRKLLAIVEAREGASGFDQQSGQSVAQLTPCASDRSPSQHAKVA
jgi:hypothetical protein